MPKQNFPNVQIYVGFQIQNFQKIFVDST